MSNQIEVKGVGFDLNNRINAIKQINNYDTQTLLKITGLLKTEKARIKFKSKADFLKKFI